MQSPEWTAAPSSPAVSLNDASHTASSNAPIITYRDGLLTITARRCTLGDILRAVAEQTGAEIDVPAQAGEIVAAEMGPGPPRDILYALLLGSQFNYVIVGSAADPNALVTVLLTPRPANTDTLAAQHAVQQTELRRPESDLITQDVQQQDNSQEPALPVRAQQQMLQQRNQMVIEAFRLNQH